MFSNRPAAAVSQPPEEEDGMEAQMGVSAKTGQV